ncbi:GreA/GreB family elongation factor [Desulfuromusa kysingii]|uniref:GreA/GreB family elongation factor n=1 Tax=Desulfuromusa kysingii TaxID=37625 RepID=A0A1H4C9B5_9BACT|nr:GreA/GreB family elongation factor [Desulfuromusa kysingii]SEA56946.1 GreA/GreB family elongation factor [Desulfuromusa kysingii]
MKPLIQKNVDKDALRQQIIAQLKADYALLLHAAKSSHAAATHEENIPDNKYATLGLEASYLAQGQANRAQEILQAIQTFETLTLIDFAADAAIRLTALVQLEDDAGQARLVFLGPAAGGLLLDSDGGEVMIITPASPLGRELLGKQCGDLVELNGRMTREYEIVAIC